MAMQSVLYTVSAQTTPSSCFSLSWYTIVWYKNSSICSKDVVIPAVINWVVVKEIWNNAFKKKLIKSVKFPEWIVKIWDFAFADNKISLIDFPSTLKSIWKSAFANNMIINPVIPKTVTTVWSLAFSAKNYEYLDLWGHWSAIFVQKLEKMWALRWVFSSTRYFSPDDNITRIQFLKITINAFWLWLWNASNNPFKDINNNSVDAKYISRWLEIWIVSRNSKNMFRPDDTVNRAEAMKMIFKATWIENLKVIRNHFKDVKKWAWYYKFVNFWYEHWIVSWYWYGWYKFWPWDTLTRWQAAKIILNTKEKNDKWLLNK